MNTSGYRHVIRVVYPVAEGTMVLRTETDWNVDIQPVDIVDGEHCDFLLENNRSYIHFKPCLRIGDELRWAVGANDLALLTKQQPTEIYPHFNGQARGSITELVKFESTMLGRTVRLRAYLPSGYDENVFKHYPMVLLQDGANVFLPVEAFHGQDWHIQSTLDLFDSMSSIEQTIVVAIYAGERERDYTKPGYEEYGESVVAEIMPFIKQQFRIKNGPKNTMVMGSSLGGVVSFYLGWEYPHVFGTVACMSSKFSFRDDLIDRVQRDDITGRSQLRIYLDSGWPEDNYDETLDMAFALFGRDFEIGRNLHHVVFPRAQHSEHSWSARCHLPLQLFSGKLQRLTRPAE